MNKLLNNTLNGDQTYMYTIRTKRNMYSNTPALKKIRSNIGSVYNGTLIVVSSYYVTNFEIFWELKYKMEIGIVSKRHEHDQRAEHSWNMSQEETWWENGFNITQRFKQSPIPYVYIN